MSGFDDIHPDPARFERLQECVDDMRQLLTALDTNGKGVGKCPCCGHSGPVSSYGDHWEGCPVADALLTDLAHAAVAAMKKDGEP